MVLTQGILGNSWLSQMLLQNYSNEIWEKWREMIYWWTCSLVYNQNGEEGTELCGTTGISWCSCHKCLCSDTLLQQENLNSPVNGTFSFLAHWSLLNWVCLLKIVTYAILNQISLSRSSFKPEAQMTQRHALNECHLKKQDKCWHCRCMYYLHIQ